MTPQQRTQRINKEIECNLKVIEYTEKVLNKANMTNNWKRVERCRMTIKRNTWINHLMKEHNLLAEEALQIIIEQSSK